MARARIRADSSLRRLFGIAGGKRNPDFVGQGVFAGLNFDITTPAQVAAHRKRPGYGRGLIILTYLRKAGFP